MTYDFTKPYGKHPVSFTWSAQVTIHPDGRERIKAAVANGCGCKSVGTTQAMLKRRSVSGAVSVWLQCSGCGHAIGSAMRREHHPGWGKYEPWDDDLVRLYEGAWSAHYQSLTTSDARRQEAEQEYVSRSREYEQWLRTSPEWASLKERVHWRSRGYCEACLVASAQVVHHITYSFGKIPPAWHLRAVCNDCHARLHSSGDDWCDYGMARGE